MNNDHHRGVKQLLTLERWRSAELETARTRYVKLVQVAVERKSAVDRVESDIAETQSFARDQLLADRPLSPEALGGCCAFAALKATELAAAQTALDESRAESDAAHASVLKHFERLSIVERLRERRDVEETREVVRLAQKRLDEHALSRLSGRADADPAKTKEE